MSIDKPRGSDSGLTLIVDTDPIAITEVSAEINEELLSGLRRSMGYLGFEEDWVELRTKLREYQLKLGQNISFFPVMVDYMKFLSSKGMVKSLPALLDLAMTLSAHPKDMEVFVSKLANLDLADPKKNPLAVLRAMINIGPTNWQEAVWYMELMETTDIMLAEIASYYLSDVKNSSPMVRYACLAVVKTGRIDTMENFIELVKLLLKYGDDFGKEVKPIMEAVYAKDFAHVDMLISALKGGYEMISKKEMSN